MIHIKYSRYNIILNNHDYMYLFTRPSNKLLNEKQVDLYVKGGQQM